MKRKKRKLLKHASKLLSNRTRFDSVSEMTAGFYAVYVLKDFNKWGFHYINDEEQLSEFKRNPETSDYLYYNIDHILQNFIPHLSQVEKGLTALDVKDIIE